MYQNQKANILLLSIVAVLAISLATPTAADPVPPDIDWVVITSVKNFVDGTAITDPWAFEMWVDVESPGDLDHIDVTSPTTTGITLSRYGSSNEWGWDSLLYYSN